MRPQLSLPLSLCLAVALTVGSGIFAAAEETQAPEAALPAPAGPAPSAEAASPPPQAERVEEAEAAASTQAERTDPTDADPPQAKDTDEAAAPATPPQTAQTPPAAPDAADGDESDAPTAEATRAPAQIPFVPDILVDTNETLIDEVTWLSTLDVTEPLDVLELVLNSLPDAVTVYPTENYYYFSFYHDGIRYAGNLRLDVSERDEGFVNFIYFEEFNGWHSSLTEYGRKLGPEDGVAVEKQGPLAYTIGFRGRTVTFNLNDLSDVTPPDGTVGDEETLIGPIHDESGLRLFLVFNKDAKAFLYFLDETVAIADRLRPIEGTEHLLIGQRTGFVFYDDIERQRYILVAVYADNTAVNNHLDGPFDQLPDNFLKGNVLLDAILTLDPHLEGELDRFGNTPDGQSRYLVAPYMQYDDPRETVFLEDCARESEGADVYACFSFMR